MNVDELMQHYNRARGREREDTSESGSASTMLQDDELPQ